MKSPSNQSLNNYSQSGKSPRQNRSTSIENSNNIVEYNIDDDGNIDVESPKIIEDFTKNNALDVNNENNNNSVENKSNISNLSKMINENIPLIKSLSISNILPMYIQNRSKSDEKKTILENKKEINNDDDLSKKLNDLESNFSTSPYDKKEYIEPMFTSLRVESKQESETQNPEVVIIEDTKVEENMKNIQESKEEPPKEEKVEESKKEESKKEESKEEESKEEEPIQLIEKKMLTNEEYEAQTKISTQFAMIELGAQIAEMKFKESMKEKRIKDLTDFYTDFILTDEQYEELWKDDFNLEEFLVELEDKNSDLFETLSIKNQKVKNEINKFAIAYSILYKQAEENNEKIEDLSQELLDREEELEQNINELDQKDLIIKSNVEKITYLEDRILAIKRYYHSRKNRMYIDFAIIFVISNLLNFTLNRFGLKYHLQILYQCLYQMLLILNLFSKFIGVLGYFLLKNTFNFKIIFMFIFGLGLIQTYNLGKDLLEKKMNIKIDYDKKIYEQLQKLNCFQKPKKD